jgi:hypothetical protein
MTRRSAFRLAQNVKVVAQMQPAAREDASGRGAPDLSESALTEMGQGG